MSTACNEAVYAVAATGRGGGCTVSGPTPTAAVGNTWCYYSAAVVCRWFRRTNGIILSSCTGGIGNVTGRSVFHSHPFTRSRSHSLALSLSLSHTFVLGRCFVAAATAGNFLSARARAHALANTHTHTHTHKRARDHTNGRRHPSDPPPRQPVSRCRAAFQRSPTRLRHITHTLHQRWKTSIMYNNVYTRHAAVWYIMPTRRRLETSARRGGPGGGGLTSISSHRRRCRRLRPNNIIIIRFNCPYSAPSPSSNTPRSRLRCTAIRARVTIFQDDLILLLNF